MSNVAQRWLDTVIDSIGATGVVLTDDANVGGERGDIIRGYVERLARRNTDRLGYVREICGKTERMAERGSVVYLPNGDSDIVSVLLTDEERVKFRTLAANLSLMAGFMESAADERSAREPKKI